VTDSYLYAETKFGITKKCIEVLQLYQISFYVLTKLTLIERDLKIFCKYRDNCFIVWCVTTIDEKIKRILEPGTPPLSRVLEKIAKFIELGTKCYVNIEPIIHFLTDVEEQLRTMFNCCDHSGLRYVSG